MKKIKYLFLILVLLLFCGCTVKYDLNIDDDLSVTEKVEAIEKEIDVKANTGMSSDKAVQYLYNIYKRNNINLSITSKNDNNNLIGIASVSYKSIDDYANNFTSDIFKKVDLNKNGNIYSLNFKQNNKLSSEKSISPIYDKVIITINVPYKVIKHNADNVYKGTYIWELEKNQELRNISISFDTSKKQNTFLFNLRFFKVDINYWVIALSIFILLIIITIIFVYLNNKKNNKI